MEQITPPANLDQKLTFNFISGDGNYVTGITNLKCDKTMHCPIMHERSTISVYDIEKKQLLLDNVDLRKHAASDITTVQSQDKKFLVSVIVYPNYTSSFPLSDLCLGLTTLPDKDKGANFKIREVG